MKKIDKFIILKVKMAGFKKFKEPYEVKLDKITYISGGNGQGKTTIADAIAYAFCGTPFWGEKSCERLQNSESNEMSVEVEFVDQDGELHTLSRRRSGGNSTVTMDTIQLKQGDLAGVFIDKDIFLSILNPLYFIDKIADGGRELLQKLLPPVDKDAVMEMISESSRAALEKEGISEPIPYIKKKREELKELDDNVTYFEGQKDLLKTQKIEATQKVDAILEKGNKIVTRKNELEKKQFDGINIEELKSKQKAIAASLSNEERTKLLEKQVEIRNRKYESKYAPELLKLQKDINSVSEKCKAIKAQAGSVKVGDKCPYCNNLVTEENYKTIIAGLKAKYESGCKVGKELMASYNELLELDKKSREKFEEFRADDLKKCENELAMLGGGDVSEIGMLEDRIRLGNLSEEEYAELLELNKQVEQYTNEVNALCETDKIPEKIQKIDDSLAEINKNRQRLKELISAATEFTTKKAELTLNQIKMKRASIKLFDVVKTTGEVKDAFRFTYDGKDYRWLSTSEKVKAGLEVANLLARLTKLAYPTYIDNAECITTGLDSMYGQIIAAFARNTSLTVSYPGRQSVQLKEAA